VPTEPDPVNPYSDEANRSYENTSLFWVSNFQYLTACVAFSVSRPFRQPLYTNLYFTLSLLLMIGFSGLLVLSDHPFFIRFFLLKEDNMPMVFRLQIILIVIANFAVSFTAEKWLIWKLTLWWRHQRRGQKGHYFETGGPKQEIELAIRE
jgi:cation-transporting ATPase 13A3/4/5